MRLFTLILFCTILATTFAEPEPKKYKVQKKNKNSNTTLTDDERKFLREVEAKFGIKPDVKEESKKDDTEKDDKEVSTNIGDIKLPFPAVIAIEIVNDTDSKTKGKRTIDANLGYGYKTNNGYSYSYFGKPSQDNGKFMIYPYSQHDIPEGGHGGSSGPTITHVEIQPSKAFELLSVKEESMNEGYDYPKPSNQLQDSYIKGLVSPPPSNSYSHRPHSHGASQTYSVPSTLYTTYNGHEFSGLSGQFPKIMPNYLVNPSQLLKAPEYQSVGLTNDHLRLPGPQTPDQRVVPVLVLRVPSSSLKNPTAELFANVPSNYPLSSYLNNVNIQELVNQYFKKMGYSFAPPVTHYKNSIGPSVVDPPSPSHGISPVGNYAKQQYAAPYVQPSYTHADHSGVQYSAVQPVMAKYPSTYPQRYSLSHGHSLYQQPMHQQKYEYRHQYVPQTAAVSQTYYRPQSQYSQQSHRAPASVYETNSHVSSAEAEYKTYPQISSHGDTGTYKYRQHQTQDDDEETKAAAFAYIQQGNIESASPSYGHLGGSQGGNAKSASPSYGHLEGSQEVNIETSSPSYGHLGGSQQESIVSASPSYGHFGGSQEGNIESVSPSHGNLEGTQEYTHYSQQAPVSQEETLTYPASASHDGVTNSQAEQLQSHADLGNIQNYHYQQQSSEESDGNNLILSENYPSKDHTIATVYPTSYQLKTQSHNTGAVQTVSYVTPMPYSSKYQSPYKIMVPQTFLMNPASEKVTYVHSQSVSAYNHPSQKEYNPEAEYTVGLHYVPPISKQKPHSFPRNYHSHPKRMTKPSDNRADSTSTHMKKHNE